MDFVGKTHRREPQEPQLATMIDVFSMLIIFLIAGTVMGTSSVILPNDLQPPRSVSKEAIMNAPQLTISRAGVSLGFDSQVYPLSLFSNPDAQELSGFRASIQKFLSSEKKTPDLGLVNLVADKSMTYQNIFDVVRVARESGFTSILFVATARGGK